MSVLMPLKNVFLVWIFFFFSFSVHGIALPCYETVILPHAKNLFLPLSLHQTHTRTKHMDFMAGEEGLR